MDFLDSTLPAQADIGIGQRRSSSLIHAGNVKPAVHKNDPAAPIDDAYGEIGIPRHTVLVSLNNLGRKHVIDETLQSEEKAFSLYDSVVLRLVRYPRDDIRTQLAMDRSTPLLRLFHMGLLITSSLNRFVLRASQDELPRLTKDIAGFDSMDFHAIYKSRGPDRVREAMVWHDIAKRSHRFAFALKE